MEIAAALREEAVEQPIALGLEGRLEHAHAMPGEDRVEEPPDPAMPRLGDLGEEMLLLGNRSAAGGDAGDRAKLGAERIDVDERGFDVLVAREVPRARRRSIDGLLAADAGQHVERNALFDEAPIVGIEDDRIRTVIARGALRLRLRLSLHRLAPRFVCVDRRLPGA